MAKFTIHSVKVARPGARYSGQVTFSFTPSAEWPLKIKRDYQTDAGEWKSTVTAEIAGATEVRVHGAFVKESRGNEFYVQVQNVDIPWDLSKAIGAEAMKRIEAMHRGKADQEALEESGAA